MQSKSIFAVAAAVLSSAGLAAFSAPPALAQQTTVFFDDFDGGSGNIGSWGTLQNVTTTDPGSLFGSNVYYFDGSKSDGDRFAETQSLDLSEGRVQVSFLLRYEGRLSAMGDSADAPEFERHDDLTDAVQVDYSTDSGANWVTFKAFGELNDDFRFGAVATFNLPSAAWQSSVMIRVFQSASQVEAQKDQWAVDDFTVLVNPEPGTWALFGFGTAGLAAWVRRRRAARRRPSA